MVISFPDQNLIILQNMKSLLSIILIGISCVSFVACTEEKKADRAFDDFKDYISERRQNMDKYYDKEWTELDNEYNEKRSKAEEKLNDWSEETKAEFASLQSEWEAFREGYENERARRNAEKQTASIMNNILPDGINNDLSNVTAANLLEVHTHFVNYVEVHKDEFTKEQWDKIQVLWKSLDEKKDLVEKDLKKGDNMKIAEQKLRYGTIKAVNRPVAESENSDKDKN